MLGVADGRKGSRGPGDGQAVGESWGVRGTDLAHEDWLELEHAGDREQNGGILGHKGGAGEHFVPALLEEVLWRADKGA